MSAFTIRPEDTADHAAIHALTAKAFAGQPHSDGNEPRIVDELRDSGDLVLSLVAEDAERIVGHIAFSPVTIRDGSERWFALGPVSVMPDLQRTGIGNALILRGIARMRQDGANGIVLLGDPDYYGRFGFEHDPDLRYPGPEPRYFQRLVLSGEAPSGTVSFPAAFGTTEASR